MAHVAANLDPNEVAAAEVVVVVCSIEHAQKCAKYFHYFHLLRIALHNTRRMQMRIELRLQMQMHFTARIHPTADQLVSACADVHVAADVDADADIRDDGTGAVGQSSRAAMSQTEQSRDQTKSCLAMRRHSLVGQSVGKNKTLSKQLECVCVCACVCIEKKSVAGLS